MSALALVILAAGLISLGYWCECLRQEAARKRRRAAQWAAILRVEDPDQ